MATATGVGVLDKVMAILWLFDEQTATLDARQVAEATGTTLPTAYRLLKAMTAHGLLMREGDGFQLGFTPLHLGALVRRRLDLVGVARPQMRELRDLTRETVELHVRVGASRVPVHLEIAQRPVRTGAEIGVPLPLHLGASGRVLLAWLPEALGLELAAESAELAGDELDPHLPDRMRRVRSDGYAISFGERDPEASSISAPLLDAEGRPAAALVVSGTVNRFADPSYRASLCSAVADTAARLSGDAVVG